MYKGKEFVKSEVFWLGKLLVWKQYLKDKFKVVSTIASISFIAIVLNVQQKCFKFYRKVKVCRTDPSYGESPIFPGMVQDYWPSFDPQVYSASIYTLTLV